MMAKAFRDAARRLVDLRDRWLNPPEWVEWVDEPAPGYPAVLSGPLPPLPQAGRRVVRLRVVCGRGRNPTVRVFTLNVGRHLATGILRSG